MSKQKKTSSNSFTIFFIQDLCVNVEFQLDSKTEKIPSLSPGRGTVTNKWVPKPNPMLSGNNL